MLKGRSPRCVPPVLERFRPSAHKLKDGVLLLPVATTLSWLALKVGWHSHSWLCSSIPPSKAGRSFPVVAGRNLSC